MQEIILDFTNCKHLLDLHKELKEKFGFPDYYGENLSALWDCSDNLRVFLQNLTKNIVKSKGCDVQQSAITQKLNISFAKKATCDKIGI